MSKKILAKPTRVNRTDLTLRNLRALKNRLNKLEARVTDLESRHART